MTSFRSAGSLEPGYARLIVARDHGFVSWAAVTGDCDPAFELAVDAVVHGRTFDTLAMLKSSAHPRAASVEAGIEHALATYLHARE